MIKFKVNELKQSLSAKGHAEAGPFGQDIVCAGVSVLFQSHINLLEFLKETKNIEYKLTEAEFSFKILKSSKATVAVFKNLVYTLKDMSRQYPSNIKEE